MEKTIEKRFNDIEKRLEKLEDAILEREGIAPKTKSPKIEKILVEKIEKIPPQHLVVISLKLNGKQTREEIKETLQDWGKVFGNWFKGGNFTNRLLKTNIAKSSEKNEKGKEIFSLTQKGQLLADELIEKIKEH